MLEPKIPEFICSSCRRTVHSFYDFKKTCLENHGRLLQYTLKLQESTDSRGQKFSELQIRIKKQNLLVEQDVDSQFNVKNDIEDSSQEHNQKIDKIDDIEEFGPKFMELVKQMLNEKFVSKQEQEVNSKLNIEMENEVLLQSLEEHEEKSVVCDTVYTEENITPKNYENYKFSKKHINNERVSNNVQGGTARSSSEDDNRLMVDEPNFSEDSGNVFGTCSNRYPGRRRCRCNFKCYICNKIFLKKYNLDMHLKIHKNIRDFKCKVCGMAFRQKWNLVRHLKLHARQNEVSVPLKEHEELEDQMNIREVIEEHKQEKNNELKIEVEDKVLVHSLEKNIIPPENNEKGEFNKKHINSEPVSGNEQGSTSRSCEGDNRQMVDEANFSADSDNVNAIYNNKNTDRRGFKRSNYKCTVCNKYFLNQRNLNIHMKIHNNIKDFEFQIRGKDFVQSTSLIRVLIPLKEHEKMQVQINNRELIEEQEQEVNNELKIKVEDEVLLPMKEHEELQHQMCNRELIREQEQEMNYELKIKVEDEVLLPMKEHEELQHQINNRELIGEQEQEVNYELKIKVEDEVVLPMKEHEELQHQMYNREMNREQEQEVNYELKIKVEDEVLLPMKEHEELNIRELIGQQEQEMNNETKIELENEGMLQLSEKNEENLVEFDIVYITGNMVARENNEEGEFNKKHTNYERVSGNEQGSTSRSRCENYNLLVVDESNVSADTGNFNSACNNRNKGKSGLRSTKFKCTLCNKYYLKQRYLETHMKIHNNIRDFKCQVCGKAFVQRTNLVRHLKIHAGVKDFKCLICNRNFSQKSTLETHMKMHVGIRDFECSFCDKKFLLKSHLKVHMDRHIKKNCDKKTEQKTTLFTTIKTNQLQCSVCERKFIHQETLDKHMRVHAGIFFFECSICKLKFANKINLGKHMINHHSITCLSTDYVLGLE